MLPPTMDLDGTQVAVNLLSAEVQTERNTQGNLEGTLDSLLVVPILMSVRTYNSCHGSVDTPIDGVDTGYQSLKQFHEDKVQCVDTVPGSVDTRPSLQKTQLSDWDSVSTQPGIPQGERPNVSRKGCGGCRKGKRGAEQCCLEGEREEEEKRRGERIKYQHPEREQSSAIRLRSRRAAKEEEELAIRMPLK
ncbi:hypothetical protein Taro_048300 [Colocasia esculenta]|uniref:Uncharacterized protein n=1 Tax=Colocasia esculenta TaxID=4460 RepID=A0A843X2L2_COLES|nr:hypothetical protein [Colocasia esculenta]